MRRYWIQNQDLTQAEIEIDGDAFHHIFIVCRQTIGSEFELLGHPEGWALHVKVIAVSKKMARTQVLGQRKMIGLAPPYLILNLSIPKFTVLEQIIEKSVEMGVFKIQLFTSSNSFIRKASDLSSAKMERLNKIIFSATQQSGRSDLMQILPPITFEEALLNSQKPNTISLLAYEAEEPLSLKKRIQSLALQNQLNIHCFIGSEGGFTTDEVTRAQDHGLVRISLGHQVLRVETACLALLGALKYELELL